MTSAVSPTASAAALLADLLPEGERWRLAPAWTERLQDLVEVTRAHEHEGVVFKRLDAAYRPGRRSAQWRKLKHRRRETLAVSDRRPRERGPTRRAPGWVPASSRRAGACTLASMVAGGSGCAERETRTSQRRRIRAVATGVELVIDAHGRADGPLRDPVIRDVRVDGAT